MSDWEKYGTCPKCHQTMRDPYLCACGYDRRNVVVDFVGDELIKGIERLKQQEIAAAADMVRALAVALYYAKEDEDSDPVGKSLHTLLDEVCKRGHLIIPEVDKELTIRYYKKMLS